MSDRPLFADTPLPSPITEFVVQITSNLEGGDHYVSGTGVIVAPFLALAARHVLDDHWARHQGESLPTTPADGRFTCVLLQLVGDELNAWYVNRLWVSELTDIVLLRLTPYSAGARAYKFPRRPTLDLMPPQVGEHIHAFGYSESAVQATGPKALTIHYRPATTHGEVMDVHQQSRDEVKMPFPCFRTNARFDGGMSGGPVFNEAGHLCGLICSSYPPFSTDEDHASYVVLLWPVMILMIDMNRVSHPRGGPMYPLFDLVKENILVTRNAHLVTVGHVVELDSWRVIFLPSAERPVIDGKPVL
jgi:hypothetical protein